MDTFLKILPLLVVLIVLLPPFRFHVLIAGLAGGVVAALVGGLNPGAASDVFFKGLGTIMSIYSVMMFAATAMVLAKAGSITGLLEIIQKTFKDKVEWVAAGMVLVQAMATFAAGNGAANLLVTAPLVFSVVGFVPALVAGLGIVSGATWATSPSSAESAYISQQMKVDVATYSSMMRPYMLVFWVLGIAIAWWGVRQYRLAGKIRPAGGEGLAGISGGPAPVAGGSGGTIEAAIVSVSAWRRATPFLLLLILIVIGPFVNQAVGIHVFTNLTTPVIVLTVAAITTRMSPNKAGEMFIEGGLTILRFLFMVGLFLGFIQMLDQIGTFKAIAGLVAFAPVSLIALAGLVAAFLVAIPSAAYTVAIDTLIIPVLAAAGVPPAAFGFVGIAVAQGAMISPTQISVSALAFSFRRDVLDIVRNNLPYMPVMLVVTLILVAMVTFKVF